MLKVGTAIGDPPRTYQEWLDCFAHMKESKINDEYIEMLSKASLVSNQQMSDKFQVHIVKLLNDMLDVRTKIFIKELNLLLKVNDIVDVVALFKKFSKEIKHCLFFNNMEFMPVSFRKELFTSVERQTNEFLQKLLKHLSTQALETNNFELEDALFQIRRIKFFTSPNASLEKP